MCTQGAILIGQTLDRDLPALPAVTLSGQGSVWESDRSVQWAAKEFFLQAARSASCICGAPYRAPRRGPMGPRLSCCAAHFPAFHKRGTTRCQPAPRHALPHPTSSIDQQRGVVSQGVLVGFNVRPAAIVVEHILRAAEVLAASLGSDAPAIKLAREHMHYRSPYSEQGSSWPVWAANSFHAIAPRCRRLSSCRLSIGM